MEIPQPKKYRCDVKGCPVVTEKPIELSFNMGRYFDGVETGIETKEKHICAGCVSRILQTALNGKAKLHSDVTHYIKGFFTFDESR